MQLPLYSYSRISVSTLEVDIAAIKEGCRSTSVHSFVTPNTQINRQSVRRVISYRFAMRTVLGRTVLGLPLELVGGKKSVFIFEFVVQDLPSRGSSTERGGRRARAGMPCISGRVAWSLNNFAAGAKSGLLIGHRRLVTNRFYLLVV